MKIRCGFVSNSSSSSFVVKVRDRASKTPDKLLLTEKEIETLRGFGFKPYNSIHPSRLELEGIQFKNRNDISIDTAETLVCQVICNEDDVIEFLLENNITFGGCCHYGHYSVFYDKDSDYFLEIPNYGLKYELYRNSYSKYDEKLKELLKTEEGATRINKEEWLEDTKTIKEKVSSSPVSPE